MNSQNPYADRPWLAAYAPEVPDAIDEVTQTLSDMIDASIARYGRARRSSSSAPPRPTATWASRSTAPPRACAASV